MKRISFPLWLVVCLVMGGCGDRNSVEPTPTEECTPTASVGDGRCLEGIRFRASLPDDVRVVIADIWPQIWERVPGWKSCGQDVWVEGTWVSDSRAVYWDRNISISMPRTVAGHEHSFLHELGHHIQQFCPLTAAQRAKFRTSQDLDPNTDWDQGPTWELTPAEQFSETFVRVIRGRAQIYYQMFIKPETVELVASWGL